MLNRKMVFRVTKSQSMKDKLSLMWYYMIILTGVWRVGGWGVVGGLGGQYTWVFRRSEWKWVQISQWKRSQNHAVKKIGWLPSKFFFFLHGKWSRGHILTKETQRDPPGTPRKSVFFCPKEGERVARSHFHERVGERREKNFGTSGSKKSCFVSEIWPFEVGICVRAD